MSERQRYEPRWAEWIREEEDPRRAGPKPEALDDLLVLDLCHANFGAFLTSTFLAELGAEVIKVEPPGGDPGRDWGPPGFHHQGEGIAYIAEGRNKYYITLSLETAEGRKLFRSLAERADVILDGHPPGEMDSWGIGYRQLREANPRLIYCGFSTYGQFGPLAGCGKPDYDLSNQALSGLVYITGEPEQNGEPRTEAVPTRVGSWASAYAAGAWAGVAILSALHWRQVSRQGQMIDISGAEALMRFMETTVLRYHLSQTVRERMGLYDLAVFPYTFIRVKDGWAFIAGYTDPNFGAICRIMGRPELTKDPRFSTTLARTRPENEVALREEIGRWSVNYTSSEILAKVLADPGPGTIVFGRVNESLEVLEEAHWRERGCLTRVSDAVYGALLLGMPTWRMTETPPRVKWACRPVGYHNGHVYQKYFGFGPTRLLELKSHGVL